MNEKRLKTIEDRLEKLERILSPAVYRGPKGARWEKESERSLEIKRIPAEGDERGEAIGSIWIEKVHRGKRRISCTLGNGYRITLYAEYIDIYEDAIRMMKKIQKEFAK